MKIKKSTSIPLILLVYLIGMSYIGRDYFFAGDYLYYFGIIATTIVIIILLHFSLKHKEKMQREREDDINRTK